MAPSKYPQELRDRATRLAAEARPDPETRSGAISRIGKETLSNWVRKAEDADLPVELVDSRARIRQLESENGDLRRINRGCFIRCVRARSRTKV